MPPIYQYDAFISYRHGGEDEEFARILLGDLETAGYKIAIDKRDFAPNLPFLDEMERCVKESRYTLAVISPRYFESGNTTQESVIRVVLDMNDREHRLIPLIIENVARPTWMFALTGIDYTEHDPLLPPLEKIKKVFGTPKTTTITPLIQEADIAPPPPEPVASQPDHVREPDIDPPPSEPAEPRPDHLSAKTLRIIIGIIVTGVLLAFKMIIDHTPVGHRLDLLAYQVLHGQFAPFDTAKRPPVVVVDTSNIPGGKDAPTSRLSLQHLVDAIAEKTPRAIAIDIDLSPDENGWKVKKTVRDAQGHITTLGDPDFFDHCLLVGQGRREDLSYKQPVTIYVGVYRTIAEPPESWLGLDKYKDLAVALIGRKEDLTRMPQWVMRPGEHSERLRTLSAALSKSYVQKEERGLPGPPGWLEWMLTVMPYQITPTQQDVISGSQLPAVSGFEYASSLVNFSKLEEIEREDLSCTSDGDPGDLGDKITDRMVILGDIASATDKFNLPVRSEPVPGALVQACAALTFATDPVYEFKTSVQIGLDIIVSGLLIWLLARDDQEEDSEDGKKQSRILVCTILGVLIVGIVLVRWLYIMWFDFIAVAIALGFHPVLERRIGPWLGEHIQRMLHRSR